MAENQVKIFDSTLRDGAQGQGISFSLEDKIKIVKILDNMHIDFIYSSSNCKFIQYQVKFDFI